MGGGETNQKLTEVSNNLSSPNIKANAIQANTLNVNNKNTTNNATTLFDNKIANTNNNIKTGEYINLNNQAADQNVHNTNAGWTNLVQGKDYDAVATNTKVTLLDSNDEKTEWKDVDTDVWHHGYPVQPSFSLDANLPVNSIKPGAKILVGSIEVTSDANPTQVNKYGTPQALYYLLGNGYFGTTKINLADKNNKVFAHATLNSVFKNNFMNFILTINNDNTKIPSNLNTVSIHYKLTRNGLFFDCTKSARSEDFTKSYKLVGAKFHFITRQNNKDKVYNVNYSDKTNQMTVTTPYVTSNDDYIDGNTGIFGKVWYGQITNNPGVVINVKNSQGITSAPSLNRNDARNHIVNENGQLLTDDLLLNDDFSQNFVNAGNNLTATELWNKYSKNEALLAYSKQSDGSYNIYMRSDLQKMAIKPEQLKSLLHKTYYELVQNHADPAMMKKIDQANIDYTSKTPFDQLQLLFSIPFNRDVSSIWTVTNETPGQDNQVHNATYIPDEKSGEATLLRQAKVQYIDDDTNKVIDNDAIMNKANSTTDYTVHVPKNYILSDNQQVPANSQYTWSNDKKTITYTFNQDQKLNNSHPIYIHVHQQHVDAKINYIDDTTSKTLKLETASGRVDLNIAFPTNVWDEIKALEGQGYKLVSNNFNSPVYSSDANKNVFEVHFIHATSNVTQKVTIKRTINYLDKATNKAIATPVIQEISFNQPGVQDLVTDQISWQSVDNQEFDEVTSLDISGYQKPDKVTVEAQSVGVNDKDSTVNVYYEQTQPKLTITDTQDHTPTTDNKAEVKATPTTNNKQTDTPVVNNGATVKLPTSTAQSLQPTKNNLAQTNVQNSNSIIGLAMAGGILTLGLAGVAKKKEN